MRFCSLPFCLLVILLTFNSTLFAQISSFSGRVYDANSQEGLAAATLILTDLQGEETGQVAAEDGRYEFNDLAPGRYRLQISYVGYQEVVVPGFLVGSGPSTNIDFALAPDNDIITCEVIAKAPAAVINPLKRSVSLDAVRRLPATFYDPARLLTLSPGVVAANDQANHLSVRGNSPDRNLWRLNGLAIVNPNHTANAGTLNDFPTFNGGGVNALSAQLLDNSTFYAGSLPAAYGNATGGTLDMRLRPGNTHKRQHQIQAGFIGFDIATEGPFAAGNPNSGSYLLNYRYSFTGLLADMGVDFGGEEIRFQDFSAHLYQPVGDGGKVSVFGLYGNSSNEFTGKDEDLEEQKELFDIDFFADLLIVGGNYEQKIGSGKLAAGFAYSTTDTERKQLLRSSRLSLNPIDFQMERSSGQIGYTHTGANLLSASIGLEYLNEVVTANQSTLGAGYDQVVLNPYLEISRRFGNFGLNGGLRYALYTDFEDSNVLEPRLGLAYYAGNSILTLSAERNSRLPSEVLATRGNLTTSSDLITPTNQINLGWRSLDATSNQLSINAYYQFTADELAVSSNVFSNSNARNLNSMFGLAFGGFNRQVDTRTYGIELGYERPISPEALYYTANLSIFRSEYRDINGDWQQGRFSRNFIFQGIAGKEWSGNNKKGKARTLGLNFALIAAGGERFGPVDEVSSNLFRIATIYDVNEGLTEQMPVYIRPDIRLYRRKYHRKTTSTLALDIQNIMGRENVAFRVYDNVQNATVNQTQLGFIPVLSYRLEWR